MGNNEMAWSLLWHLMRLYRWPNPKKDTRQQHGNPNQNAPVDRSLGLTLADPNAEVVARQDEVAMWLSSLPRVHALYHEGEDKSHCLSPEYETQPLSFYIDAATDGILLAAVASELLGCNVTGIIIPARTEAVARANISKALDALRLLGDISKRYLYIENIEDRILIGSFTETAGLLFDCMRCGRGMAPLPSSIQPSNSSDPVALFITPDEAPIGHTGPRLQSRARVATDSVPSTHSEDHIPREEAGAELLQLQHTRKRSVTLVSPSGRPLPMGDTGVVSRGFSASVMPVLDSADVPPSPPMSLVPSEAVNTSHQGTVDLHAKVLHGVEVNKAHHDKPSDVQSLLSWLNNSLHIFPEHPEQLQSVDTKATDFSDGLLLARIVEVCENLRGTRRGEIPGMDRNPKTGAAKLANVRRSLEILRQNKAMPLDYLWSELAIRDGDAAVVRALLLQIKKAYAVK
jgi:hypothetical protein